MKTKLLVALIACLALGACSKHESGKEEKKTTTETTQTTETAPAAHEAQPAHDAQPVQPVQPAAPGHSSLESDHQNAAATDAQAHEAANKVQEMSQDMSNTAAQVQNATTEVAKADAHNHGEN